MTGLASRVLSVIYGSGAKCNLNFVGLHWLKVSGHISSVCIDRRIEYPTLKTFQMHAHSMCNQRGVNIETSSNQGKLFLTVFMGYG